MNLFQHFKTDWFRYGFETLAVIVGILVAFTLDNWNDERKTKIQTEIYLEKLIEDLVADTIKINGHIARCVEWRSNIASYFAFFDQGGHDLDVLLDSSTKVRWNLFRYFPINYTITDMQSSGNTNLLNAAQRNSLIALSGRQRQLQIIIDVAIKDIRLGGFERNKLLDRDMSKLGFYEGLSIEQDVNEKVQGLKLQHQVLSQANSLYYGMIVSGGNIKENSRQCIELLKSQSE